MIFSLQGDGLKWRVGNTNVFHYEGVQCPEKGTDGTVTGMLIRVQMVQLQVC